MEQVSTWTYCFTTAKQRLVKQTPEYRALRVPEFREAWVLCFLRKPAAPNIEKNISRKKKTLVLKPATELRAPRTETSHLQLGFEQEVLDTKL